MRSTTARAERAFESAGDRHPLGAPRSLAIIGPPGAGKTAQAVRLAAAYDLHRVSVGALVRERTEDHELQRHSRAGTLVPDDRIAALVEGELRSRSARSGVVLDGFPRTVAQARALDRLTAGALDLVVELSCDAEVSVRRVVERHRCLTCRRQLFLPNARPEERCDRCGNVLFRREEDTEDIARRRLEIYERYAAPIREHFDGQGKLLVVRCARQQDALFASLRGRLEDRWTV